MAPAKRALHTAQEKQTPGNTALKSQKVSIVGSLRDREVACSASDRQGSNFESCVWRTVSSQSSHHPQEVLLAQFSLYVHKGGLKPDSFHLKSQKAATAYFNIRVKAYAFTVFGACTTKQRITRQIWQNAVPVRTIYRVNWAAEVHRTSPIFTALDFFSFFGTKHIDYLK